jgi:IS1 family transposase
MRSIARAENVNIVTVARLLSLAGAVCKAYHDAHVQGIPGKRNVQCDEIWSFVYAKERQAPYVDPWDAAGHTWTFTALDADSKLLISYLVAHDRGTKAATRFFKDLVGRLEKTPKITTDELISYKKAAKAVFGPRAKSVLSQMRKGEDTDHSTAYVERHNLTIRMGNRRFNRRTNAFSKKFSKHIDMMHLWVLHYNFCRIHTSLRVTPAMEAGIETQLRDCKWIVELIDAATPPPKKPGPKKGMKYQPRNKR